ncbi:MAG: serine hydrolase [Deltaproteobacteria bacterium]|jgi:CubicO group peptidase (beta-lactamase class C family)|nr:serine hydrolase [Deltaproteobacteria bacterium]
MRLRSWLSVVFGAGLLACAGEGDPPGFDAGQPGVDAAGDAGLAMDLGGLPDAGDPSDVGQVPPDLGLPEVDGGLSPDASPSGDVGPSTLYFPPTTGDTWETLDPVTAGWDLTKLEAALTFAESKDSTAVIILQHGRIVTERYWQGWELHQSEAIFSASKSVTAILIGMLLEDGALTLDDPVSLHLGAGWTSAPADKEALITVRHLLTMTSGLTEGLAYEVDAGTKWYYNTSAYHELFGVIDAAAGMSRDDFAQTRLHDPIGMQDAAWRPQRLNASARDMARFGLLILANGVWDGAPILTHPTFLAEATQPSQNLNPSYGYLWWLNGQSGFVLPGPDSTLEAGPLMPDGPSDLVAALGAGDKKIYVVPSRGLVVARHGGPTGDPRLASSSFDNVFWQMLVDAAP